MNLYNQPVYPGHETGRRNLVVDHDRVARYCRALGCDPEGYRHQAPALVLHSECYEDLSWYLRNLWGNLHARQEWEFFRPMGIGATVSTRGFVRGRYRKRGRDYVVKETWILDGEGRLLNRGLTHQSFLIETSTEGEAVSRGSRREARRAPEPEEPVLREFSPLAITVDEDRCMDFSGPARTYHTDREEARKLGFPDIVVQGMFPICLAGEAVAREFGEGWAAGGTMDVRLVNVLWAGEHVSAHAHIVEVVPEADRQGVHMKVRVEKADGTPVIVGRATAYG